MLNSKALFVLFGKYTDIALFRYIYVCKVNMNISCYIY